MDIVERLREFEATDCCSQRKEAADEIERLRKVLGTIARFSEEWGAFAEAALQQTQSSHAQMSDDKGQQ